MLVTTDILAMVAFMTFTQGQEAGEGCAAVDLAKIKLASIDLAANFVKKHEFVSSIFNGPRRDA